MMSQEEDDGRSDGGFQRDGEDFRRVDVEILDELEQLHHRLARLRDERGSLVNQLSQLDEMYHHSAQQVRELRSKLANLEALLKSRGSVDYEELIETMSRVEREKLLLEKKISLLERRNRMLELKEVRHKEDIAILTANFQKLEVREDRLISKQQKLLLKCDRIKNVLSIKLENKSQECEDLKRLNAYLASRKTSEPFFQETDLHQADSPEILETREPSIFDEIKEAGILRAETLESDSLCQSSLAPTRCGDTTDTQSLSSGFVSTSIPPPHFDLELKNLKKKLLTCIQLLNYLKKIGFQAPKEIFVYPLITQATAIPSPGRRLGDREKKTDEETCNKEQSTSSSSLLETEQKCSSMNKPNEDAEVEERDIESPSLVDDKKDPTVSSNIDEDENSTGSSCNKGDSRANTDMPPDSESSNQLDILSEKKEMPCSSATSDSREDDAEIMRDSNKEKEVIHNKDEDPASPNILAQTSTSSAAVETKISNIPQRLRRSSLFPTGRPNDATTIQESNEPKTGPPISPIPEKDDFIEDDAQFDTSDLFPQITEDSSPDLENKKDPEISSEQVANSEISDKPKKSVHDLFKETFSLLKNSTPQSEQDSRKEEEELSGRFSQLILSIKIDHSTLEARVQRIAHQRDLIQNNLRRELQKVKEELATLYTQRSLQDIVNVISKASKMLDVVSEALCRLSGRSEDLGIINQEKRFSEACQLMMQYAEFAREKYTAQRDELAQLQEKCKQYQENPRRDHKRPLTMRSISLLSEPLRKLKEIQESKANRRHSDESCKPPLQNVSRDPGAKELKPVLQKRKTIIPLVRSESQPAKPEAKVTFVLDEISAKESIPPMYDSRLCFLLSWGILAMSALVLGLLFSFYPRP